MRHQIAFASLGLVAIATIAAACAGFSSEETPGTLDSGAPVVDSAPPAEVDSAPNDSGVADSGPKDVVWLTPVHRRSGRTGFFITARPGLGGTDLYFSELAIGYPAAAIIYYAPTIDGDAGVPVVLADDGGVLLGNSPAPALVKGIGPSIFYVLSGVIYAAPVDAGGAMSVNSLSDAALPSYDPFVLPLADGGVENMCYFATASGIQRSAVTALTGFGTPKNVKIESREHVPVYNVLAHPVATRDEHELYFSATVDGHPRIWSAKLKSQDQSGITFEDAHPLVFESTGPDEFPTALSLDEKELYFTGGSDSGASSTVYSMKQAP